MDASVRQRIQQVLLRVCQHEVARAYFNEPVDLGMYPEYTSIVETPMDFGTIRRKLSQNAYPAVANVLHDARLIFSNCRAFNDPTSDIMADCRRLEAHFKSLWV
ncbi:hypothetical protein H632_c2149p0, partial [Helicosporidium sp. ATCC 50920]